ncbi:MAG: hypothetical protein SFV18_01240 [Bryobacteraceae bacterium]|nr:hypothetical protein [Bryobacteraceae bacterium]
MATKFLLLITACGHLLQAADYVPLKAEATFRVFRFGVDGTRELVVEEKGTYVRDQRGNDLRRMKGARERGEMRNLETRKSFTIEYSRGVVLDNGAVPPGVPMSFREAKPLDSRRIVGEEIVSGIRCIKVRGMDPARHNFSLISREYDLLVRSEVEHTDNQGQRFLTIVSLENIQLYVAPDAKDFHIPPSFQILERKAPETFCSTCARSAPR